MSIDSPNADFSSSPPPSAIGTLAALKEGEVALPPFFLKREDGLFIDLSKLDSPDNIHTAVDRIFSANTYFTDLDYGLFTKLLYDDAPTKTLSADPASLVRFASDIVAFRPERRALYKEVTVDDGEAEYYFDTVYQEHIIEEPVYGEGEDGSQVVVRIAKKTTLEPTTLTFDEFVADMWGKGVHFGIDADTVRPIIRSRKEGRVIIARRQEAILGKAADTKELSTEMHRDDAPKVRPDGRVDLCQFKNRFPQIKKGARLIKKIPLVMGVTGHELSGAVVEPPLPKDINLAALGGPGTGVEVDDKEGECIVAQQDGFLNIDPQTKQISITDKIISREEISASTTGDLILTGDEFEGYGEVQENRLVEGNTITIHANVYGTISSRGGAILLKRNLVGGMATNQDGDIIIEGIASSAVVQTRKGGVFLKRAENCTITGTRVVIESASNCDILADEVTITKAEGCAVVAKGIVIGSAGPHKQNEMLAFVLVPPPAKADQNLIGLTAKMEEIEFAIKERNQEVEKISRQPELRNYVMIGAKLRKNEIVLTPEQQENFQKLTVVAAPMLKLASKFNTEITGLQTAKGALAAQVAALLESRKEAEAGIHCSIAEVTGETIVNTMTLGTSGASIYDLPPKSLKAKLRGLTTVGERLFTGRSGSLNWVPPTPD